MTATTHTDPPADHAGTRARLRDIYAAAHEQTLHPNALGWPGRPDERELDFISHVVHGRPGMAREGCAYLVKELAQLAEIERHLSAVFGIITAQLGADTSPISAGYDLHHALSCFAAEEYLHADFFYRYVRELAGSDIKLADSLFTERLALYQGDDSPYVKLAAMCMAASICRIGLAIRIVKPTTRNMTTGKSANSCQSVICCAWRAVARMFSTS